MSFETRYELYRAYFERELGNACAAMEIVPDVLRESMQYSLLAGGKRIRPILFLSCLELLGCNYQEELPLAVAIESIHTYSLIHDDLPAIDNDDLRRGRPSNHVVYGEANAILAGDGLLSYAMELLLLEAGRDMGHLKAAQALAHAAGVYGMVAGQSADLLFENKEGSEADLLFIHTNKTGRMIAAPLIMASRIAGKQEQALSAFGETLGLLFQLTDDLLDGTAKLGKTPGKDSEEGKFTALKIYGEKRANDLCGSYQQSCHRLLDTVEGDTQFLHGMVDLVARRDH